MPNKNIFDIKGNLLKKGDNAILLHASPDLLNGLPSVDKNSILSQVNRKMLIQGFDDSGNVELEFIDENKNIHFIWVNPKDLLRG